MMNPPVTLKPQENGNTFKQLVALDGNDYQFDKVDTETAENPMNMQV